MADMIKRFCFALLALSFILLWDARAHGADVKISGLVFGDYYAIGSHNDSTLEGRNGFWLRRGYLTFDSALSEKVTSRLRFEVASPGDFKTKTVMTPFIKDASIKWKPNRHSLSFGLIGTPTWEQVESLWGYRSVEKTPVDLQKMGDSRDLGISLAGSFSEKERSGYTLMLGNGSGTKGETNKPKRLYATLFAKPTKDSYMEVYGDWEDDKGEKPGTDVYTLQAFLYIGGDPGRAGIQFVHQGRQNGIGKGSQSLEIVSAFGVKKLSNKWSAYLRVDHMLDPNPAAAGIDFIPMSPEARSSALTILGLDFQPIKNVSILPNVEMVFYGRTAAGERPDRVAIPRVTVFYKF